MPSKSRKLSAAEIEALEAKRDLSAEILQSLHDMKACKGQVVLSLGVEARNGGSVGVTELAPFDAADYMDDEETIAEYLAAAREDPNPDVVLTAARDVARARSVTNATRIRD